MKHINIADLGICTVDCPEYQSMIDPKNAPTDENDYYQCNTHYQYYKAIADPDTHELALVKVDTVPASALHKF